MYSKRLLLLKKKSILLRILLKRRKARAKKRIWIKKIYAERKIYGAFYTLIPQLREQDPEGFKNYLRVTPAQFDYLVSTVHPFLVPKLSKFRSTIQPDEKLAITLRFLSSGDSVKSISYQFRTGYSTTSMIIAHTCSVIWKTLQPLYMTVPTMEKWEEIAQDFEKKWDFPNCVGAIDGKHIAILAPDNSGCGSLYYNDKEFKSIVLLAVCDAQFKFTLIDVGDYGHHTDSTIFNQSQFGQDILNGKLSFPNDKALAGSDIICPYVLVGTEAFALETYMMRPFPPSNNLTTNRKIFNYRLCRVRRIIDNCFGILSARWKVFQRPIQAKIDTIDNMVKSACVLHNFIMNEKADYSVDLEDQHGNVIPGSWREEIKSNTFFFHGLQKENNSYFSNSAVLVREKFVSYFDNPSGYVSVPWQFIKIKRS